MDKKPYSGAMQMNYDRLLTRVFDKQEKEMLYEGDIKQNFSFDAIIHGINSAGLIQEIIPKLNSNVDEAETKIIPFGNRYIPMQCSGFREDYGYEHVEDGLPVFEFDFIKTHVGVKLLIKLKDGCWIVESPDKTYSVDLASLQGRFSVIGNKFLNSELLEQKQ